MSSRSVGLIVSLVALGASSLAQANGRAPAVKGLAFHPTDPQTFIAQATFGLVQTHDAGQSWDWICEQAIGYSGVYDPHLTYTLDGVLLVTAIGFLARSEDQGCTFSPTAGLPANAIIGSVAASLKDPNVVVATVRAVLTGGGLNGGIFRSVDAGKTFTAVDVPNATGMGGVEIRFSQVKAGLVVARLVNTTSSTLAISQDDGVSWTLQDPIAGTDLTLLSVGIANPQAVYLGRNDGLLIADSVNGTPVAAAGVSGHTVGIAEVGTSLFAVADTNLLVSSDAGTSWTTLNYHPTSSCLESNQGSAYLCADNFIDQYALGVIETAALMDPRPVMPELVFKAVTGPAKCADSTPVSQMCAALWPMLTAQLGSPTGTLPDGGASDLGLAQDATNAPRSASGCTLGGSAAGLGDGLSGTLAMIAGLLAACGSRKSQKS